MIPAALLHLFSNPIIGGGTAIGLAGTLFASLKSIPGMLFDQLIKRQLFVSCRIDSSSPVYNWVMDWLGEHPYTKKTRSISAHIGKKDPVMFAPAPGAHLMFYKRRPFWVSRDKHESKENIDKETILFTTFGRNQAIFHNMFEDILQFHTVTSQTITKVYINDDGYWDSISENRIRPLNSVILPEGIASQIETDVTRFVNSADWYHERCIPHRRGYLFYGPPGNGKSSLAAALAGTLGKSIYILSLSSKDLTDERLMYLMTRVPPGNILLIEDVDAAFVQREKNEENASQITFSGLLNAIDGVGSRDGQIVVMSTNHPDKLDPALIRPGRVDLQIRLDNADDYQRRELFTRFFPETELADEFVKATEGKSISMAALQTHLLKHRDSSEDALRTIKESEVGIELASK